MKPIMKNTKQYKLLSNIYNLKVDTIIGVNEVSETQDHPAKFATVISSPDTTYIGCFIITASLLEDRSVFEEIKPEKKGRCLTEPEYGEEIWTFGNGLSGIKAVKLFYRPILKGDITLGIAYWDKEYCEKEIERLKVLQELRVLAGGFEPDWSDCDQVKYYIVYDIESEEWQGACEYTYCNCNEIYFATHTARDSAIDKLGDRLNILKD